MCIGATTREEAWDQLGFAPIKIKYFADIEPLTKINQGDRICQFRIMKNQPPVQFEVVEHLNSKSRGGLGSTGR